MLGRYIHEQRNKLAEIGPISRPHPPLNILHICFGVSIIGLAFFQVSLMKQNETQATLKLIPTPGPQWFAMVGDSNRTSAHNALGLPFVACMDIGTWF
jgi:hypothetical protein